MSGLDSTRRSTGSQSTQSTTPPTTPLKPNKYKNAACIIFGAVAAIVILGTLICQCNHSLSAGKFSFDNIGGWTDTVIVELLAGIVLGWSIKLYDRSKEEQKPHEKPRSVTDQTRNFANKTSGLAARAGGSYPPGTPRDSTDDARGISAFPPPLREARNSLDSRGSYESGDSLASDYYTRS